ncbi:MAG: DNA polymerase I [Clostridia bacterium]|nr:DNA polymerase I [Clostridia bacterium]
MKKLVLIDGNSLLNRAFYATPVFTTSSGMPTNAIFGFVKLLFKIESDVKPDYLIVAFDMKAPTFRHKMYDGYKATRKPMPEDLAVQVEPLKNLLKAMNVAICQQEGIEADDILGTLSKKFNVHSYVYTGDRDSYQLVDEKTDVYFTKRGVSDLLKLSIDNFKTQIGLDPSQVVDLKSLMGDSSDNIPGVPGIGEKTALSLLEKYSTLDGIYENIEEIKGANQTKLKTNKELAYLSYKLATIDRNCNLDINLEDCVAPKKYGADVRKLFTEFEFKSFLTMNIFDGNSTVNETAVEYPEKIICQKLEQIEPVIAKNSLFSVVLEEDGAEIYTDGKQYSLKIANSLLSDEGINWEELYGALRQIFSNPENKVIAYDCKSLMHDLKNADIAFECDFEDLLIADYLCDYETASMTLKEVCGYYGYNYEFSAFAVSKAFEKVLNSLKTENMLDLYENIEKPLVKVLFDMEIAGVLVSSRDMDELAKQFRERAEDYKWKVFKACDKEFNINSPMQLGDVLYNDLKITEVKKKKNDTKYTTSAEVLEKLVDKYPVVADILKYRFYQKITSTYIDGYRPLIRKDGTIHTTFNQTITTTGRLSSSNPNLQNIPIRDEEGKELRRIFVAREGNVFIDADYSQIELRLLAHFSGCKELIEAYNQGKDIHATTASQVFGVPFEEVTPKMRRSAKAVNFGIIYGISDFGLAKNLNISNSTAKEYIEKYFATYSSVKEYMDKNVEFAKEHGYICTLTGRKRVIPEIKSANYNLRQFGERASMNMPLQGSSADIIKIAMVNVAKALKEEGLKTKLILQVHDELILEAPEEEAERAGKILKDAMENAVSLKVPLTVEVHTGKNWYDAK